MRWVSITVPSTIFSIGGILLPVQPMPGCQKFNRAYAPTWSVDIEASWTSIPTRGHPLTKSDTSDFPKENIMMLHRWATKFARSSSFDFYENGCEGSIRSLPTSTWSLLDWISLSDNPDLLLFLFWPVFIIDCLPCSRFWEINEIFFFAHRLSSRQTHDKKRKSIKYCSSTGT